MTYVNTTLDTNSPTLSFTGAVTIDPKGPSPAQEFASHLANFEAVGVRYVVTIVNGRDMFSTPFPALATPRWPGGPHLVYHDSFAERWESPSPAPTFSLTAASPRSGLHAIFVGPTFSVASHDLVQATVSCSRPSVL